MQCKSMQISVEMLRNMPLKYVSQWEEKSFGRPRSCRRRRQPAYVLRLLHKMAAAINIRRPQKRLTCAITLFLLVCAIEKCRGDSIMVDDMKHFRVLVAGWRILKGTQNDVGAPASIFWWGEADCSYFRLSGGHKTTSQKGSYQQRRNDYGSLRAASR